MKTEYKIIANIIIEGSKVLDVGCDDGALMEFLKKSKDVNIIETHTKPGAIDDIKPLFGPTPIGNKIIEIEKNAKDKI